MFKLPLEPDVSTTSTPPKSMPPAAFDRPITVSDILQTVVPSDPGQRHRAWPPPEPDRPITVSDLLHAVGQPDSGGQYWEWTEQEAQIEPEPAPRASAEAKEIDRPKRKVLTVLAVCAMLGGLLGGLFLAMQLAHSHSVETGFWTALLTVSALSAFPLVATSTQVVRLWLRPTWNSWDSSMLILMPMLAAAGLSLIAIVLCLYEIAVTSGSGDPNDLVIFVATPIVGAIAGAAVFGVAAAILDKTADA